MCGIACIYHYRVHNCIDRNELLSMRDAMATRGPDGSGAWFAEDECIGLAHRRLSIIDLSEQGAQPMVSEDGRLVVSFNGEIYNYRELRAELEGKGYRFRSHSDTEVLLHLYTEKGTGMLHDLRGMFAFALWDGHAKRLLLARDPYGIKPLYYADDGQAIRAASQVKALVAGGVISRQLDPAGIAGFYLFGNVPEPFTIHEQIRAVPAGSYIEISEAGAGEAQMYFSIARLFSDAEQFAASMPREEAIERIRVALLDSIRHHCIADVPVGAFLSAGIDSGAIIALVKECGYEELRTATLGFSEYAGQEHDEALLAAEVAAFYDVSHATRHLDMEEFGAELPSLLGHMDQLSIDGVNTYFVSKAAAELGWKVALSGVGGDELFGGYPSFRDIPKWVRAMAIPSRIPLLGDLFRLIAPVFSGHSSPKLGGMVKYGGTYAGAYMLRRGLFLPEELPAVMDHDMAAEGLRRLAPLTMLEVTLQPESTSPFARVSTLESSLYMCNQLLRDADWAGMAHSLEIRTPLVDSHLIKAVAAPMLALGAGKQPLALAPKKQLPEAIRNRAKTGFLVPVDKWLQKDDRLDVWKRIPSLKRDDCPWARRWAYTLVHHRVEGR